MTLTAQSDVGRLRRVVVKHVRDAFVDEAAIDRQWQDLNYYGRPDLPRAIGEYDNFVELMSRFGIAVDFLPVDAKVGIDSLYPRDTTITTDRGVILCNMGKPQRRTEPEAIASFLRLRQTKILGTISGAGSIEGGDVTWLDPRTLAVGSRLSHQRRGHPPAQAAPRRRRSKSSPCLCPTGRGRAMFSTSCP